MTNSRFSVATHILTLLATAEGDAVSSEMLAGSINIHPVQVRKELVNLRKRGFIGSKEGKNGGSFLSKRADQILLSDVYKAVRQGSLLGRNKNEPNPECPVGRRINQYLSELYDTAELALVQKLEKTTLADFSRSFS